MDLKGILITVYDDILGEPLTVSDQTVWDGLTFETPRFPKHWYRSIRASKYLTYYTSELSPPEVGGDSAMELGMEL